MRTDTEWGCPQSITCIHWIYITVGKDKKKILPFCSHSSLAPIERETQVRQMEIKISALRTMLRSVGNGACKHCSSVLESYSLGHRKGSVGRTSPEQVHWASRELHKKETASANHSSVPPLQLANLTKQ